MSLPLLAYFGYAGSLLLRGFPSGCGGHFLLRWLSLLRSTSSRARGPQQLWGNSSIAVAPGLKTQAQYWWYAGLAALRQAGSSQTTDGIHLLQVHALPLSHQGSSLSTLLRNSLLLYEDLFHAKGSQISGTEVCGNNPSFSQHLLGSDLGTEDLGATGLGMA